MVYDRHSRRDGRFRPGMETCVRGRTTQHQPEIEIDCSMPPTQAPMAETSVLKQQKMGIMTCQERMVECCRSTCLCPFGPEPQSAIARRKSTRLATNNAHVALGRLQPSNRRGAASRRNALGRTRRCTVHTASQRWGREKWVCSDLRQSHTGPSAFRK